MAGVVAARWVVMSVALALAVGAVCVIFCLVRSRRILIGLVFCGGACLGLARGAVNLQDVARYGPVYGHQVTLTGVLTEDVDVDGGLTKLRLNDVVIDGRDYPGQAWVTVHGYQSRIWRSDRVTVQGVASRGFGNFPVSVAGAKLVDWARPDPGDVALAVRDRFADDIRQSITEPGASLGIGFMLGQKSMLPSDLLDSLKIAGLTHIVVASGYNLTVLVRIGRRWFSRLSKYLATLFGAFAAGGFVLMTGFSPSMTRAGIVSGLSLWAWYYGRKFHPVTLLGVAAAATLLINPSYIWGDVGWILSFAAFAGVMIIAPLLGAYFFGNDKPPLVVQILFETIAATVATVPVIIAVFGTFSNVSLLANLLILPFISYTMFFILIGGLGAMIGITILGWGADMTLRAMVAVVEWCASLPWAESQVSWQWWGVAIYVVLLVGVCMFLRIKTGYRLYQANLVE